MKKIAKLLLATVAASALLCSCGTTKVKGTGVKGKAAKAAKTTKVLVDYQGSSMGVEVPEWVKLVMTGVKTNAALAKSIPGIDGYKVFVTQGRGDNLDMVQQWADLVDIETEVAGTLERVAAKAVQAEMTAKAHAEGKEADATEVNKNLDMYRTSLTNTRFSGLEKVASYWTEIEEYDKKELKQSYFEYYAVWGMPEAQFTRQMKEAMSKVDETTTEAKALKEMVSKKLQESLGVASNVQEVTDAADDESVTYDVSFE